MSEHPVRPTPHHFLLQGTGDSSSLPSGTALGTARPAAGMCSGAAPRALVLALIQILVQYPTHTIIVGSVLFLEQLG